MLANDLTHEGITIEMQDLNEKNSDDRIAITYGLPSKPCSPDEEPPKHDSYIFLDETTLKLQQ
jgi:hypothetical protein